MNALKTKVRSLFGAAPPRRRRNPRSEEHQLNPKFKITLPDGKDVFLFGGLGLSGYGLWQIYPPSALILVGGVFFAIGVFWYMGGSKNGTS